MRANICRKMGSTTTANLKTLLMLDVDHTVIDGNSDTWILRLLPDQRVPKPIKNRYKTEHKSWTIYMREIFEHMHSIGITEEAIHESIAEIPLVPGMRKLLEYQQSCPWLDCVVASDSNSYFIDVILGSRNLQSRINRIFTNRAEFDSHGCLKIHFSNPHSCPRQCPVNLCKQTSILTFLEEQKSNGITYNRVCVIGDGHNDLCPCMSLKAGDIAFPRKGYSLDKLLQEMAGSKAESCLATVVPWDSATRIVDVLKGVAENRNS